MRPALAGCWRLPRRWWRRGTRGGWRAWRGWWPRWGHSGAASTASRAHSSPARTAWRWCCGRPPVTGRGCGRTCWRRAPRGRRWWSSWTSTTQIAWRARRTRSCWRPRRRWRRRGTRGIWRAWRGWWRRCASLAAPSTAPRAPSLRASCACSPSLPRRAATRRRWSWRWSRWARRARARPCCGACGR